MNNSPTMLKILAGQEPGTDRKVLETYLRFVGQEACFAGTAEELRQCLQKEPYDLLLLSVDDAELAALAQLTAQVELWVGLGQTEEPPFTPPNGWFGYLAKPLDLESFQDCIRAACRRLRTEGSGSQCVDLLDHSLIQARHEVDPQLVSNLIAIFKEDTPEMIDQIRGYAQSGDWEELKVWAHKFKGMTGNVGAAAMSALGHRIERAAEEAQRELAPQLAEQLSELFDQTGTEFDKLISKLKL